MAERLYRSRRNRIIGGVAGGMAENLGVDPTIVRLVWIILAFVTHGLAILIYFVLLFVVPEAPEGLDAAARGPGATAAGESPPPNRPDWRRDPPSTGGSRSGGLVLGIILVLVGAWLLLRQYLPVLDIDLGWPFVAIALGVLLIVVSLVPGRRP